MVSWAKQKQAGFTIVELLIVIVVIAILATISVVAYGGIQSRANKAAVEADITTIIKKLEIAKIDLGHYPRTESEFPRFKFNKAVYDTTQHNILYCLDVENDHYALGLRSKSFQGYVVSDRGVSRDVVVSPVTTCDVIGKTWVNNSTTYALQGYYSPPTSSWNTFWSWTN